jgi:uncharacterized protein (TIGR01244 family)
MFIRIDDRTSVAGQLSPADLAAAKAQGFALVINNRPDGEAPDQPAGRVMAEAAAANGLGYLEIPIAGGFSMPQVEAMAAALAGADGPVLAFCRSGTRSTNLWALARAAQGGDADAIVEAAGAAGYDVSGMMPALRQLSAGRR